MKFTVAFITLLSISSSWAVLAKRAEDAKDKREASSSYQPSSSGHSSSSSSASYQAPSVGHGDASSISVGAGYSIGGAKPQFSFGGHGSGSGLQLSSEGLQSGHGGYQLAPITLQPQQGIIGTDLSQIMSQLQHSLNSGALSLQPSNTVAEFHEGGHSAQSGQEYALPQFNYGSPNLQQYALAGSVNSAPSYAVGTKGLSSYGSTGPVLFNPNDGHGNQQAVFSYAPSAGHSAGDAGSISLSSAGHHFPGLTFGGSGHSLGGLSLGGSGQSFGDLSHSLGGSGLTFDGSGYTLGGAGHSLGGPGYSLGSSGHSLGGLTISQGGSGHSSGSAGHALGGSIQSLGDSGHSLGGSGHSFGGSGNSLSGHYKALSGGHAVPSKSGFKPSAFLGASFQSDSGLSSLSASHGAPSFGGFSGSSHSALSHGGHGSSLSGSFGGFSGASKHISPLYTKSQGSSDSAAAYSSVGHLASPPGTTYGFPTASYPAGAVSTAFSSGSPHYYQSSSKYPGSFGEGSSSFRAPSSSHSSLSSHSSGPKFSFGGHSSTRYASPKDSHGAYSETSYNTIKYSEELKPRVH